MADVLDKLIRLFRDNKIVVKVGILENSARFARNSGDEGTVVDLGNADVGAIHEFGTAKVPRRSFLRMPLETQMQKQLDKAKIDEETIKGVVSSGNFEELAEAVAGAAKACVDGAFDTGGYGFWAPHSSNTPGGHKLLVETAQLRASISSEVVKK